LQVLVWSKFDLIEPRKKNGAATQLDKYSEIAAIAYDDRITRMEERERNSSHGAHGFQS
jgi:hypothetical protein